MTFFSHFGSCRLFVRVALVMGVVALSLSVPGFSVHPVATAGAYHATSARSTGFAGMHKLNAHAIRVHAAHRYIYTHHWAGNSPFSLHVLLTNGQEVVIPAGLSGNAEPAAIEDRRIQAHG